ncbi:hypothetical protein BZA77DRAFT_375586 [Pyronema omphalodes]|nr:hypothetical protein BZA77DRAFT_375586 [Pyronema omphalodes]
MAPPAIFSSPQHSQSPSPSPKPSKHHPFFPSAANFKTQEKSRSPHSSSPSRSPPSTLKPYPPIPPIYSHLLSLPSLAAPFLPHHILQAYPASIQSLLPLLSSLDEKLLALLPQRSKNWTHSFLTAFLLSSRSQLAVDRKLGFLLQGHGGSREEVAARLLWAVGGWKEAGYQGKGGEQVKWQIDGLLAGFAEPGLEMDVVRLEEAGETVVVWTGGRAWEVGLFRGGKRRGVAELQEELEEIVAAGEYLPEPTPSISALSHRLPRAEWARAKDALGGGDSMVRLHNSLLTVSLEPYALPIGTAAALDDIRGNTPSPNRFADQTCGLIIYADGRAGLTVDRTVADLHAGLQLGSWLSEVSAAAPLGEPAPLPQLPHGEQRGREAAIAQLKWQQEMMRRRPRQLKFPKLRAPKGIPLAYVDAVPRIVQAVTLGGMGLDHQKRQLCLLLALQKSVGPREAIVVSVPQTGIVNGREDWVMGITEEMVSFWSEGENKEAFEKALKSLEKRTTEKHFPFYLTTLLVPALNTLPSSPALETIKKVIRIASGAGAEIQFSGLEIKDGEGGVEAGLSSIDGPNKLSVFYLAREDDEVEVAFSATGHWRWQVDGVVERFLRAWEDVVRVAVEV